MPHTCRYTSARCNSQSFLHEVRETYYVSVCMHVHVHAHVCQMPLICSVNMKEELCFLENVTSQIFHQFGIASYLASSQPGRDNISICSHLQPSQSNSTKPPLQSHFLSHTFGFSGISFYEQKSKFFTVYLSLVSQQKLI